MDFLPKKCVVVPVDFSERSLQAVEVAQTLVETPSGLHIVHILPLQDPMDPDIPGKTWSDDKRLEYMRDALVKRVPEGLAEANVEVFIGEPARGIAARAEELGADLIVMPSHGRTGAARFFIGSVAERVVRHAHCPVLVLRD